jgi:hypothetical protein
MSFVSKGQNFEDRVFHALQAELQHDRLGLSPRSARLFRKKHYYSRDRGADIRVDLSIEAASWPIATLGITLEIALSNAAPGRLSSFSNSRSLTLALKKLAPLSRLGT